jgi:hypothetical protein
MADFKLTFNKPAWNEMVRGIVDTECVERMGKVAATGNAGLHLKPGEKGYMVSTEGDEPLTKHSYRATCITAGAKAVLDNAKHNTLIRNFHQAGG